MVYKVKEDKIHAEWTPNWALGVRVH